MKKKILSFVLSVVMLLTVMPFSISTAAADAPEGFTLAAQNERLSLYYKEFDYSIAVRDRANNRLWYSYLPKEEFPEGELTDEKKNEIQSLLIMEYSQANIATDKVTTNNINTLKPQVSTKIIANGFTYTFFFEKLNLQLTVEFSIEGDRLNVCVPNKGIQEGVGTEERLESQKNKLTTFIQSVRKFVADIESDSALPHTYKKNTDKFSKEINNFENNLKLIKSAVRIESAADQLTSFVKKMKSIALSGEASNLGIINKIRLAEDLSDTVKQRYNTVFSELSDTFELAELSVAGLKAISVTSLVELHLLPYFGSSGDKAEGYMMYPDGSGAISYFKENHPDFSGAYRADIYSSDTPDLDVVSPMNETGQAETMLPVIGVKKGANAFAAVATSGDQECFANFYPSGYIINTNRTFLGFTYRRKVTGGSNMGSFTGSEGNFQYETERRDISPEVTYIFLADDKADYSGMANAVRALYLQNGTLQKSEMLTRGLPPMALDVICGINRKQLIFDNYLPFTTYYQVAEIINDISRNTNMQLMVNLHDWEETESLGIKPLRAFGGDDGFKVMTDMAKQCGTEIFMAYNPYLVTATMSGYKDGDLAVSNNLLILQGERLKNMVLSPPVMLKKYETVLNSFKRYQVGGIALSGAGRFLYYDYNPKRLTMRADCISYWKQALKQTKENLGTVSVIGGNRYTLDTADWLQEIPNTSSGYSYSDENIPFYQMVVHGSIPYSGKFSNAYYDPAVEKLKTIEYGYTPIYSVSYNTVEYSSGFTSVYKDVRDELLALCKEYYETLGCVASQAMIDHEIMGDQVKVTYENGVVIYLNYSTSDATVEGHTVKAQNYIVVGGKRGEDFEKEILEYEAPGESDGLFVHGAVVGGIFLVLLISVAVFVAAYFRKRHRQANV